MSQKEDKHIKLML